MRTALAAMIEALGLEIAEIRRTGGGNQIALRGGERVDQVGKNWLYRFIVTDDLNLRDDTPVRVASGDDDVPGMLVSFREGVLLVSLEQDLGVSIPTARLITNDAFLVERLKIRLEEAQAGDGTFNRPAADRVLGLLPPRSADAEPDRAVLADGLANADQERAVRRSLGSDLVFVWGPPGTGKTTTLARIVEAHFRAGRSVLLVANTNIAADTALERVAERLKGETDFHLGLVIRQGPVVKEELRQRFGPQIVVEEIVARLGASLRAEDADLAAEAVPFDAEERALRSTVEQFERFATVHASCAAREDALRSARTTAAARQRESDRHAEAAAGYRALLDRAESMNFWRRLLARLDAERLERDMLTAKRAARAAADAARSLLSDVPRLAEELRALRGEADALTRGVGSLGKEKDVQARLAVVRAELARIRERQEAIARERGEIEEQALARCRVLATTVYRTYLGSGIGRQFDAVVIDEASMLMPPLVYYAAGLASQSVTIAGDFRQLPPIVKAREPLAVEWLKSDVFERAGIPEAIARGEPTPHLVALGTQYRMREPICDVINEVFYADHPLRSDPSVSLGGKGFPLASSPVLYVDTSAFQPWAAYPVGTYSRYNLVHALLVRNLVLHLDEAGFIPPLGDPNDAIGVVSPYGAQARLIQSMLDDRLGGRALGMAATVHRFQGNEKSVMLIDLTDSYGAPLGRFLRAQRIEEDGARLLNVAASRAKHHVILIANFAYLRAKAPAGGIIRRLLNHFEDHGAALSLTRLLPRGERDWLEGLPKVSSPGFDMKVGAAARAFSEATFYPAFLHDLSQARQTVVILSPFTTGAGTARFVEPLRAALARGVRVRIVTRPPDSPEGGTANVGDDVITALRDVGITVDLRRQMHEKIAIVDGRILWHGSLNIFSHRDTHESMLRIDSVAACDQVGRFISVLARSRPGDLIRPDEPENPPCPSCGAPTVWSGGRSGVEFLCERRDCDGRVGGKLQWRGSVRDRSAGAAPSGRGGARTDEACPRPGCGGLMRERHGRHGPFVGCSNYPTCRFTASR